MLFVLAEHNANKRNGDPPHVLSHICERTGETLMLNKSVVICRTSVGAPLTLLKLLLSTVN